MAEKGPKLIGAALTIAMAGGCAPNIAPVVTGMGPVVRRAVLDCPTLPGQEGDRQIVLRDLTPGQKVIISNRSTELLSHEIEVQDDGQFAILGQNPQKHEPGQMFAASGYPDSETTIYHVVAGEPEFSPTSNEMRWVNASSAITAFCIVPGPQSPYGKIVDAASAGATANQG